jgi:hypothetical protein
MQGNGGDNLPPRIWERRRRGGGLGGGGGLPVELEARGGARFGGVRGDAARDLRSPSRRAHVPPLPLYACYTCARRGLEIV